MRRNIIFDFGNVLVRWEPQLVFLPYFGGDEAKYWFFWRHVSDPVFRNRIDAGEDQMKCIREQQQLFPEYAGALDLYYTKWEDTLPGEMPGMRDLVTELKADSRFSVFGLTNWSGETFPTAREKFPVLQLIDNYVVSGNVGLVKPDHRIFRLLLDRFSLMAEDCIFVDDNPNNVTAAEEIGLEGILFTGAEALRKRLFGEG